MPESTLSIYIVLIIGVMVVSGALGGAVSGLLSARDDRLFSGLLVKHAFIGMVAALTVPLLLNMLSSDVLETGYARPVKLFTVSGLSIILALFSTRLLEGIFGSRMKDEEGYVRGQDVCEEEAQPPKVAEITAKVSHIGSPDKARAAGNQLKILEALADAEDGRLNLISLMQNTEISQKDFDETLSLLMAKGAVAQVLSGGNKLQLVLTARGRQQLNKTSVN